MLQTHRQIALWLLVAIATWSSVAKAEDVPAKRVLAIGIDGLRPDALQAAATPHLDRLSHSGSYSHTTRIQGTRYRKSDTSSGPGWSSFLTGVWADKHGVTDNSFQGKNYQRYPHFFALLKQQFSDARTGSFVDWEPIDTHIVTAADMRKVYPASDAETYTEMDAKIAVDASSFLTNQDPHATMVYFGAVDETGHRYGFHPSVRQYVQAIERVDQHVGTLMAALAARTDRQREDWLVVVSTDHGGQGKGHGGGQDIPEIYTTFLIVSGPSASRGQIEQPTYLVDLPVTALVHLGVKIDPAWQLDGRPVGLK